MKRILLTSTALFVLAGAAAAEVSFSGTATLGYNTDENSGFTGDDHEGFYWDGNIAVSLSQELDNGVTASADFDFDFSDEDLGQALESGGVVLSLSSDLGSLIYGDTAFAAETYWASAGDMEQDSFSEADGETVLRGELVYGTITAGLSYVVANSDGDRVNTDLTADAEVDQLSVGMTASFGAVSVALAYQEESSASAGFYSGNGDFNQDEVLGISATAAFAGADITVAYATNSTDDEDSIGLKVAYPFGPVTGTVYYVEESNGDPNVGVNIAYADGPISVTLDFQDDQGTAIMGLEGSYDLGNGLEIFAGYLTEDNQDDRFYVAGSYDLGGGASLLVSYAEDDGNVDEDEIGAGDYQRGTTIEVSLEF